MAQQRAELVAKLIGHVCELQVSSSMSDSSGGAKPLSLDKTSFPASVSASFETVHLAVLRSHAI